MNSKATSRTFTKSFSYETKDSGSTARQSSEELSPIPDSTEVEQPSGSIPEQMQFLVGEDTEQLSDVTDPEIYSTRSSAAKSRGSSSSHFFVWFSVSLSVEIIITTLKSDSTNCDTEMMSVGACLSVDEKQESTLLDSCQHHTSAYQPRNASAYACTSTESNHPLFSGNLFAASFTRFFLPTNNISSIMYDQPSPCIFTYEPWSPCSASCWDGSSNYPQMQRYVNKNSIVQARGGDKPDCPDDLHSRVDLAPCNTFRCPTNLSQYPFTQCYYKDSLKESSDGCYRIRNIPLDDRLIFMDANLTENCSETECGRIETSLF
ncbi:hypothetical protein WUBG_05099 [Wuchereria bancrofti]|uniref:Uncharacterized protein n=1 Tax=Wuchereria bancrofti TaxID=6293 RepID=J9BA65_WUCBA|nr:hypothetical protein WUBG_05099 [Wuchereria bancrofti]